MHYRATHTGPVHFRRADWFGLEKNMIWTRLPVHVVTMETRCEVSTYASAAVCFCMYMWCVSVCASFCPPITFQYIITLHFNESVHLFTCLLLRSFSLSFWLTTDNPPVYSPVCFSLCTRANEFSHFIQHFLWGWDLTLGIRWKFS